jgi:molybdopterin-guanine dinucleotide biosynthesis adapter protein
LIRYNTLKKPRFIHIVGRSGSGKTTLIERLIRHYRGQGFAVAAVKSTFHDITAEPPGKDTARFREAGASGSLITDGKTLVLAEPVADGDPRVMALQFFHNADIVILEGFKDFGGDKIEVVGDSPEEPLCRSGIKEIVLIVSDRNIDAGLPLCRRSDIKVIADTIDSLIFRKKGTPQKLRVRHH